MAFKIRGILQLKLIQLISSFPASNGGRFITRSKNYNLPISRFKVNAYQILPEENVVCKKPFSRKGPCRIGMAKLCRRIKIYDEPFARYPVYPGIEKTPISTYVTNWRWYAEIENIPERRKHLEPRAQGVGMDGYLQAKYKSGLEEKLKTPAKDPVDYNSTERRKSKDVYWE